MIIFQEFLLISQTSDNNIRGENQCSLSIHRYSVKQEEKHIHRQVNHILEDQSFAPVIYTHHSYFG